MLANRQGSIHLFRFAQVDVFLHWSWFLVAVFEINARAGRYSSVAWNVLEYLALFLIVLLHEYGHALARRQVGGTANQIVLWPLGGVAYVDPPPRPGATLWSITAGPLVNVALLPILMFLLMLSRAWGWALAMPNAHALLRAVLFIDVTLLLFNLLPIYPLDGGQILRSLLWFVNGAWPQFDGGYPARICRRGGANRSCLADWVRLVWRSLFLHVAELLGRIKTIKGDVAPGQVAASRRVRLSVVQNSAANGKLLDVRSVQADVRHFRNPGWLPALRAPVRVHRLFGLRQVAPHERLACSRFGNREAVMARRPQPSG
jgi:Zn-dependent protease